MGTEELVVKYYVYVYCHYCDDDYICYDETFGPFDSKEEAEEYGESMIDDAPCFTYVIT